MNFFDQLQQQTDTQRQQLLDIPLLQQGVSGSISKDLYLAFLSQAYHHVKHTVPLLMHCGAHLPQHLAWMQSALIEYINEESGHEQWILNDIEASGGNAEQVKNSQANFATEVMVAYAYDTISRHNAISFFGMVYVLEGTSIKLATQAANNLQKVLDLPKSAFSYLLSHGSLDQKHMENFATLINQISNDADQQSIIHCAQVMFQLYGNIFRSLTPATASNGISKGR